MITYFEASMRALSINWVGNKIKDEGYVLSEQPVQVDQLNSGIIMSYFLRPFEKVNQLYSLYHPSEDLHLNPIYSFVSSIFSEPVLLNGAGKAMAIHLHDAINHPKIKSGELYIACFDNIQIEGELLSAVGIFKSETKETYLKVSHQQYGFGVNSENEGININNLDKGCLIFNTKESEGYKVAVIDRAGSKDAIYWIDEFLGLKVRNDNYTKTETTMQICRSFILDKLTEDYELSSSDKSDLLNRSLKYFKEKESFDQEEFTSAIFDNKEVASSFKVYKSIYDEEFDTHTPESFDISGSAVKKKARAFKSVIKLDKNFQIHIHGSKDLIERGFDSEKSLNFYKVYFKEEQ